MVAGAVITAVVFQLNIPVPYNLVAFVLLSLVFAYILWTASLRDHATPAARKSFSLAPLLDLTAHRAS